MKKLLLVLLKWSGFFHISRRLTQDRVRILCYHGVWMLDGHFGNFINISPKKFENRIKWLSNSPYRIISLEEAVRNLKEDSVDRNSVVITIDDGWYSTYKFMEPVLSETDLPATIYVTTESVDNQLPVYHLMLRAMLHVSNNERLKLSKHGVLGTTVEFDISDTVSANTASDKILDLARHDGKDLVKDLCYEIAPELGIDIDSWVSSRQFGNMTYDELREMQGKGFDIQLHMHAHRFDVTRPDETMRDLRKNRARLQQELSCSPQHFCYPSGVYSEHMFPRLSADGIASATTTEIGLAGSGDSPLAYKRILDGENVSQIEFEAELSGALELIREFKVRSEALLDKIRVKKIR